MRRRLLGLGAFVIAVAVVVEIVALPVATRRVGDELERSMTFEDLRVQAVDRPVLPRLLIGRAHGVEVEVTGLRVEGIRVEHARLDLPVVRLPWSPLAPPSSEATLSLRLTEDDLGRYLVDRAPFGLQPTVELTPGLIALSVRPIPVRVQLIPQVDDGALRLTPTGGFPDWFDALDPDLAFDVPDDVELQHVEVGQSVLLAVLRVREIQGVVGPSDGVTGDGLSSDGDRGGGRRR